VLAVPAGKHAATPTDGREAAAAAG
jgi:hypothetical protein